MEKNNLPLKDIMVLDATQALAGPFVTTLLADLGAEVIHVENPKGGDFCRKWVPYKNGIGYYFEIINRNKKSLTLDLKSDQGREAFLKLAKRADVMVENFAPGVVDRLGIGYSHLEKVNSKIIYCHVSGYGQTGPYSSRAAFDQVMQGETGILSYTGTHDTPCKINVPITDYLAALFGAYSVLASLIDRAKTGKGMELDVSLFDCSVNMMLNLMNMHLIEGLKDSELRMGSKYHLAMPYQPFQASDNQLINVCVATEPHWKKFCKVVGLSKLADDELFRTNRRRLENREMLEPVIEKKMLKKTRDEWIGLLTDAGVPCSSINSIKEVLEHPQVIARQTIKDVDYPGVGKVKHFNNPVKFSGFNIDIRRSPMLGENTDEVLKKHGFNEDEIIDMRKNNVL